ncbi:MAG: OmpA family protein [Oscillospiraceae bacterium]|nr:OmpA family protein [Oscillospiraceae bacterium]
MRIKYSLCALTAAALCLSATGCWFDAKSDQLVDHFFQLGNAEDGAHVRVSESEASAYLDDPYTAFSGYNCTQESFFGKYCMQGTDNTVLPDEIRDAFLQDREYINITGTTTRISAVPYRIDFGPHCNVTPLNYLSGYLWAQMYFYDSHGEPVQVQAAYTVQDNTISFRLIRDFSFDSKASTLDYSFSGNTMQFGFTLDQNGMKLSCQDGEVTLVPMDLIGDDAQINIYDAHPTQDSPVLDGIETINITPDSQYVIVDGVQCAVTGYEADPDGLFRMKWNVGGEHHAIQMAFLYGDDNGIILLDGENVYNYTHRSKDLYTKQVTTNLRVADTEQLSNLSDAELEALQTNIGQLYTELENAFAQAGVAATVNRDTGEVSLDSVVLFQFDKYTITPEGEQMLRLFLQAYTSVVFSEKYSGMISEIEIEGHTDPTGLIYHNQVLSQARAEQVMAFCQSTGNGLTTDATARLAPMLSAVGYAADHPVFDANGQVDYVASRRVSFRFVMDLGAINAQ